MAGEEAALAEVVRGGVAREAAAVGAERDLRRPHLRGLLLVVALRHGNKEVVRVWSGELVRRGTIDRLAG
jgi:hypothetical protein